MLLISICDEPNSTWKAPYSGYKQGNNSTQSAKICPNLYGGGGGFQTNIPEILEWGHSRNFEPKFSTTGASFCITDISHTLRKQVA